MEATRSRAPRVILSAVMGTPWNGAVDALRWVAGRPRLLPLTALLLRARTVRPSSVFVLREALRRRIISTYRLREEGLWVAIRHCTGDVVTLGEVFHEHDYRPPAELERGLGRVGTVVDLGANIGLFGAFAAARWPEATIVGFEADPDNAAVHERAIAVNGLQVRWRLVRAVATAYDGTARFVAGGIALSHVADAAEEEQATELPACDVLPALASADLAKIDIEGGEWAILGDPRFRAAPPRALVLEYHPRFCPGPDARVEVESAMRGAGLHVRSVWHRPDGHGMLWAWRT